MKPMNSKQKILLVEDDHKIASVLKDYFQKENFDITLLHSGDEVIREFRSNPASVILLDILLPGENGISVFNKIRAFSSVPILFLTAKVEAADRLFGLELGADDYICKPFIPQEVVARVKAVLRRTASPQKNDLLVSGPLVVNTTKHRATASEKDLLLTPVEFKLLTLFISNPGKVFTRNDLIASVQGDDFYGFDRTIDSHISNLRKKIARWVPDEKFIHTLYSVGYWFDKQ